MYVFMTLKNPLRSPWCARNDRQVIDLTGILGGDTSLSESSVLTSKKAAFQVNLMYVRNDLTRREHELMFEFSWHQLIYDPRFG